MTPLIIDNIQTSYLIDETGKIYNTKTKKFLLGSIKTNGYVMVKLTINGIKKDYSVHRLVAETFLKNPENKSQVNHIDRNKQNNNVSNLEWVTGSENMQHVFKTGYNKRQKINKIDEDITEDNGWKQYKNTNYWCNKDGRCVNLKTKKYLNAIKSNDGYLRFAFYINNKREVYSAHRIIYEVFSNEVLSLSDDINHLDGNRENNDFSNLEKVSRKDNMLHSFYILQHNTKKIEQYDLNNNLINTYDSMSKASRELNIEVSGISQACSGKIKTYKGFYWKIKQ